MLNMQGWEWIVWAVAAFIAVTALGRLMLRKRDEVFHELLTQAEAEQRAAREAAAIAEWEARKQKKAGKR